MWRRRSVTAKWKDSGGSNVVGECSQRSALNVAKTAGRQALARGDAAHAAVTTASPATEGPVQLPVAACANSLRSGRRHRDDHTRRPGDPFKKAGTHLFHGIFRLLRLKSNKSLRRK